MNLDQLRIFVVVAECEHLTRAAERLALSPSAVSNAIRALEERHAVALFDRVARRIELTEVGRSFLVEAREVIARAERAEARLAELAGRVGGTLRIEASLTTAAWWLPARLVAFHRAHPQVAIEVAVANTTHVVRAVSDNTADVGFVEGDCEGAALAVRTVARDRLVLVAAPDTAAHLPKDPVAIDLASLDWVMREPGSGTRQVLEDELSRRGIDPRGLKVSLSLPSNEAVATAVVAGGGVTALSAAAVRSAVATGQLTVIDPSFLERPFRLLRRADRTPNGALRAFLAFLEAEPHGDA